MSEIESQGEDGQGTPDYGTYAQYQVTLNGYRTHYVDVGDGPPVVLVHGSPLSSYSFRHQIAALSHRFRVIAPDLLGFGQSQVPEEGASFLLQSENLRALLDKLDLDPFRLLVHDWGGPVGLGAVADRAERVCLSLGALLAAPVHGGVPRTRNRCTTMSLGRPRDGDLSSVELAPNYKRSVEPWLASLSIRWYNPRVPP